MSNNFQRFEMIGRLGRDPVERIEFPSNIPMTEFSVCVESFNKDLNTGDLVKSLLWTEVRVSGALAVACKKNLTKGRLVYVLGSLAYDKYGNPLRDKAGQYDTPKFVIKAAEVKFLDPINKPDPAAAPIQPLLSEDLE